MYPSSQETHFPLSLISRQLVCLSDPALPISKALSPFSRSETSYENIDSVEDGKCRTAETKRTLDIDK